MHRIRRQLASWIVLLAATLPAAAAALTLDDVVSLVRAGVGERIILKQVQSTGTRLVLTVEGILALKAAGASDALIESLMGEKDQAEAPRAQADPAPAAEPGASFRIYKSVSGEGGEVLHITNLDEHGRRIGGELTESERRTMVSRAAEYRAAEPVSEPSYSDGSGREPVVVNIFNPEREYQPSEIPDQGSYGSGYAHGIYPGLLATGYYGGFGGHGGGHFAGCGHRVKGFHSSTFHQGFGIVTPLNSTIPQVINVKPFTRGTAHQRNNRAFGRH